MDRHNRPSPIITRWYSSPCCPENSAAKSANTRHHSLAQGIWAYARQKAYAVRQQALRNPHGENPRTSIVPRGTSPATSSGGVHAARHGRHAGTSVSTSTFRPHRPPFCAQTLSRSHKANTISFTPRRWPPLPKGYGPSISGPCSAQGLAVGRTGRCSRASSAFLKGGRQRAASRAAGNARVRAPRSRRRHCLPRLRERATPVPCPKPMFHVEHTFFSASAIFRWRSRCRLVQFALLFMHRPVCARAAVVLIDGFAQCKGVFLWLTRVKKNRDILAGGLSRS